MYLCSAAAVSWYREFKRLYDCIPCVEVQTLREHHDQVLHLAFSHSGHRFSSCSKDCTVKVRFTLCYRNVTIRQRINYKLLNGGAHIFDTKSGYWYVHPSCVSFGTPSAQTAPSLWCTAPACVSLTGATRSSPSSTATTLCSWCQGSTWDHTTPLLERSQSSA